MPRYPVEEALLREPNLWVPGKKPVGSVKIDWGHSLTNDLITCSVPGATTNDLVSYDPATFSGDMKLGVSQGGQCFTGANSSGDYVQYPYRPVMNSAAISIFSIYRSTSGTNLYSDIVNRDYDGSVSSVLLNLYRSASNTKGFGWFNSGWKTIKHTDVDATAGDGLIHSIAGTANGTNTRYLYLDGIEKTSDTPASGPPLSGIKELTVGSYITGATRFEGDLYCIYFWGRQLSGGEISALHKDPYQFLIPA